MAAVTQTQAPLKKNGVAVKVQNDFVMFFQYKHKSSQ